MASSTAVGGDLHCLRPSLGRTVHLARQVCLALAKGVDQELWVTARLKGGIHEPLLQMGTALNLPFVSVPYFKRQSTFGLSRGALVI